MKITFLLTRADAMGGTERAIYTQAEFLAHTHQVEVLSIFRTSAERFFEVDPRITVRYLVDSTGAVPRPARESTLTDAQCAQLAAADGRFILPRWESAFNRLADIELERALRQIDADVLVATTPALMAAITTLAPPHIVTVHQEHRPSQLRGPTGEPLFQFAPRLDALVVLTERTREWFQDSLGDFSPHLQVIGNAMPVGYRPRSSLTNRVVTIAGRVVSDKQVDHAIRAFATVAEAHPDWVLRVLGDGVQLAELRRLAESLGLHDNVQFLGSTPHMAREWSKSSIALLTSKDGEALPLVLIEAFAAGVPAVSYDCQTGPAEIITEGENGYIIGPGDVAGLSDAIIRLIEDEPMRQRFGAAAFKASEGYDLALVMSQWEELYQRLLAERDNPDRQARKVDRMSAWVAATGGSGFAPAAPRPDRPLFAPTARSIERGIQERNENLVRSAGRLSIESDDMSPHDAARMNLELVTAALDERGIRYWVIRDPGVRIRVGISVADRAETMTALAEAFAEKPVYAEIITLGAALSGVTLATMLGATDPGAVGGLRVFQPVVTTSRTLRYGPAYGCDVEFWRPAATEGDVQPLRRTVIGDVVPAKVAAAKAVTRIGGREHPTLEAFGHTLVSDVTFPIDVVYTWVDGDDPAWQAKKAAVLEQLGVPPVEAAAGDARFRSRDELRYSLRSIAMFAPWVRKIWLVTDDQTPDWLDVEHPDVTVVSHKEIFGDRGTLPTFNSHAIETQLHHVDGLAEHFLYFNDDVFLGRPLQPSMFFAPNGTANFFMSPTAVPLTTVADEDDFNFAAGKNNRALVEAAFGRTITHAFLHTPHPLRVSVLNDIEERFADAVENTARNQLRSPTDIAVPSSLHHYVGYFTERSVRASLRSIYVDVGNAAQHPALTQILTTRGYDVFCLNDTHHGAVSASERAQVIRAFMESYFPVPCEYERGTPRNRAARREGP
jgi:glycosyltransferase involved in cell wall biosynthesis